MRDVVLRVAKLAKLSIEDAELERYAHDLAGILKHVDLINELDLTGVEPTSHAVSLRCPTRDDGVERALDPEKALAQAPEREGSAFKVPKILE
jgi:aspartyl-tRNA(Asn)/glutamyl-tRNA(Gln) amidotransferase subunit C